MNPDDVDELYDYDEIVRQLQEEVEFDEESDLLNQTSEIVKQIDGHLDMRFDRDGLNVTYKKNDKRICVGFHGKDPNKSILLCLARIFNIIPKRGI